MVKEAATRYNYYMLCERNDEDDVLLQSRPGFVTTKKPWLSFNWQMKAEASCIISSRFPVLTAESTCLMLTFGPTVSSGARLGTLRWVTFMDRFFSKVPLNLQGSKKSMDLHFCRDFMDPFLHQVKCIRLRCKSFSAIFDSIWQKGFDPWTL